MVGWLVWLYYSIPLEVTNNNRRGLNPSVNQKQKLRMVTVAEASGYNTT